MVYFHLKKVGIDMDFRICFKAYLFGCVVFITDASVVLTTDGSMGSREIFECNKEVTISCKTEEMPDTAILEINDKTVLNCQLGFCTSSPANNQNHVLSYDIDAGIFNVTKQTVEFADSGTKYKCTGEFDVDSFNATVKVLPDKDSTSIASTKSSAGAEINVVTGCVFPASEITFSWFYYKVGSSKQMLFNDNKLINEITNSSGCAAGTCGGNGVETKKSTITIQTVAAGCDYIYGVEVEHSDAGISYMLTAPQTFKHYCKDDSNIILIIILCIGLADLLQRSCLMLYLQTVLHEYRSRSLHSNVRAEEHTFVLLQSLLGSETGSLQWFEQEDKTKRDITCQQQNGRIHKAGVLPKDATHYQCTCKGTKSQTISLDIEQSRLRTRIETSEGSNVILPCSIKGKFQYPAWKFNDKMIINENEKLLNGNVSAVQEKRLKYSDNEKDLAFKGVTLEDAGVYICTKTGYGSHKTELIVKKRTTIKIETKEESNVVLPCPIKGEFQYPAWNLNEQMIVNENEEELNGDVHAVQDGRLEYSKNKRDLAFKHITFDDAGVYSCTKTHNGSHRAELVVKRRNELDVFSVVHALKGTDIILPCPFTDVDQQSFDVLKQTGNRSLHKHERMKIDENHNLLIRNVMKNDTGVYTFKNRGHRSDNVKLIVTEHNLPAEEDKEESDVSTVVYTSKGSDITISCPSTDVDQQFFDVLKKTSNTSPFLESKRITVDENHNLLIRKVTKKDADVYIFKTNQHESIEVRLIVTEDEQHAKEDKHEILQALVGSELILQSPLDVEGEVNWSHNGKVISFNKGSKLTYDKNFRHVKITNIQKENAGRYTCSINDEISYITDVTVFEEIDGRLVGGMVLIAMIPVFGNISLLYLWRIMRRDVFGKQWTCRMNLACMCCVGCGLFCSIWDCCCTRNCSKVETISCTARCCLISFTWIPLIGIPFIIAVWFRKYNCDGEK